MGGAGTLQLPNSLFGAMQCAPLVCLQLPMAARVAYLRSQYAHFESPAHQGKAPSHHPHARSPSRAGGSSWGARHPDTHARTHARHSKAAVREAGRQCGMVINVSGAGALREALRVLQRLRGADCVAQWQAHADAGRWDAFVEAILEEHYDEAYAPLPPFAAQARLRVAPCVRRPAI